MSLTPVRTAPTFALAAAAALAALLAGCAGDATPEPNPSEPEVTSTTITSSTGFETEDTYYCDDQAIPLALLLGEADSADQLPEESRGALEGVEVHLDDPSSWAIIEATDERVVLLQPRGEVADNPTPDRDYSITVIERGPDGTEIEGEWALMRSGPCALQADLDGLTYATVTLDPANPPTAEATSIALLVTENNCAGGLAATDRVVLHGLAQTEDEVQVMIGVTPQDGAFTCPSNPPTPFTVELDAPLGERTIVNAGVWPMPVVSDPVSDF